MPTDFDDKKNKGKGLDRGELSLWKRFVSDITPFHDVDWDAIEAEIDRPVKPKKGQAGETAIIPSAVPERKKSSAQAPQLDRRTEEKLRKGQMEIEGRLDLHGYTQERAHEALLKFIATSQRQGMRCVLVITGKGKSHMHEDQDWVFNDSVLRQRVPEWVSSAPLASIVLKIYPAQIKHGGEGAYYIYLRRDRTYS